MGKGKWLKRVSILVLIFFSSSTIVQAGGIPGGFAPQNNKDLRELDKKGEAAAEGKACTTEYNAMDQQTGATAGRKRRQRIRTARR